MAQTPDAWVVARRLRPAVGDPIAAVLGMLREMLIEARSTTGR
jgi:hypothetical protein